MRLGRATGPIVFGTAEAVQGRSEQIVKLVEVFGGSLGVTIKQAGELGQLLQRLGDHGV